jgi:mucin-19
MSKSSYLGANVEVTTDSFGGWIGKTNLVIADMATVVVTVAGVAQPNTTNGAQTTGNAHIQGIFSANTLSVSNALRGGSVSVPATLNVTSNAVFTSVNGTIDVTSSINLFTVDANNVVVSSNVVFDGGATKIFLIDAANTTVNTGSFFAKSNTYLSGVNTYITSTELKSTSNTIITGSRIDIDGTTFDVTSNSIFTAASLNANVDVMTIGFSAADTLNVNAISDFNANVNIDGILTQTANAVFSGALVNITSVNTTIGDAGTDILNVNAVSDFNANVNIDGVFTVTANATFTGAETFFNNNVTLGASIVDTVSILGYVDEDILPSATTVDLGSSAKPWGNVHTTYVWADSDVEAEGQMVLKGLGARTFRVLSANTSYPTLNVLLSTSADANTMVMAANTTGIHPGANTTYDLGSVASNWLNLYVKDTAVANSAVVSNVLTVNAQANTASLMVRDLTATRVPFVGTAGEIVDSTNFVFTSANNTLSVTGNTTVSANLTVTNVVSAANVAATHVGTATLSTSGLATINSMNVVTTATFNANVDLQDSDYLLIGTGDDLQIFHDGLNSYIKDAGTGELIVDASTFRVMNAANTENMIVATEDAGVILYSNNVARIETTLVGANVTGTFGTSGLATLESATITNALAVSGTSSVTGASSFANNVTISGNLTVQGTTNIATNTSFTVNNSISTSSTTGNLTVTGNTVLGDISADDKITLNARVINDIIPNSNNAFDIGNSTNIYRTITANNFVGNTAWGSIQGKPSPVVTVTLTGDVAGTGSATLTDLATSGTISFATTIQSNSVALGTDTTGNYMSGVTSGSGITVTHTPAEGSSATIAHADTSSVADVSINTTDGTVLQDLALTFDTFGHVQTATASSTNLDNRYLAFRTFTVDDTDTEYTWSANGSAAAEAYNDTLTLVSGTDINIDVDAASDAILISSNGTLSSVTSRGATTSSAITISNATDSTTTTTGALIVSGGLGLAKQLRVGGNTTISGAMSVTGNAAISGIMSVTGNTTISGLMTVTGNTTFSDDVTIAGDLIVNGTTTTINSTTLAIDDKNIELGSVAVANNTTADGGGITLKAGGNGDKTFNWVNATGAWTSSEDFNLLTGKVYEINGTTVLSSTTLGSGVTGSSLTSVGTLTTGTWNATTITVNRGGTGATTLTGYVFGNGTSAFTASNTIPNTDITGLGTMSTQAASSVSITGGSITGITDLAVADGGTGISSYAVGDILFASGSATLSKLADVATGNALISGGVGIAPSYGKIGLTTHVSGTLDVDNGGTGQTTYTNGQLLIGNTTGNTLTKATLTAGQNVTITNGTGSISIAAANTNLGYTTTGLLGTITSSTGTSATINAANSTVAGLVTTSTQDIAGLKTFTSTITGNLSGNVTGNVTGNASTATQLETTRSIILTGDVSGSATFNGTANATITVAIDDDSHNHIIANVDGLQTALDAKAPLASPTFTGTVAISSLNLGGTTVTDIATQAQAEAGTSSTVVMTPLRVAQAIDAQAGSMTLLGTLSPASGTTSTLSGLTLTSYRMIMAVSNNLSVNSDGRAQIQGIDITDTGDTVGNETYGMVFIDLATGVLGMAGAAGGRGSTSLRTSSTSIAVTALGGSFYGTGSIRFYGVK